MCQAYLLKVGGNGLDMEAVVSERVFCRDK